MLERALHLDTFAPPFWDTFFAGLSYYLLGQYEEALARYRRIIEQSPKFAPGYLYLACVYVELDRFDEARDAIKSALEIVPQYTCKEVARIWHFRLDEVRDRIFGAMRQAGLPEG